MENSTVQGPENSKGIKIFNSTEEEFLHFSLSAKTKTYRNILKNGIQGMLYVDYFKIETFFKIISIITDSNLNKASIATFILNTNYKLECLCTGTVLGQLSKIQEQLLKHFLDAIFFASVEVRKTLTSMKRFCFCNSTVLQHNTNLLQTRSKNAAFAQVFVFPIPTLKE